MRYPNGTVIELGEIVRIDDRYCGRVTASMDTGRYLPGEESWSYLEAGIMVHTDFAGLVHYTDEATDALDSSSARQRQNHRVGISRPPDATSWL